MGGFCCSSLMKVLAILLCLLVALSFADDSADTSVSCTTAKADPSVGCTTYGTVDLDDWTAVTLNASAIACYNAVYESDDSEEKYFVLAIRPGDDGANPTAAQLYGGIKLNGTFYANLCVQPQANQVDDEMDFLCSTVNGTSVAGTSGNVTLQVTNSVATPPLLRFTLVSPMVIPALLPSSPPVG